MWIVSSPAKEITLRGFGSWKGTEKSPRPSAPVLPQSLVRALASSQQPLPVPKSLCVLFFYFAEEGEGLERLSNLLQITQKEAVLKCKALFDPRACGRPLTAFSKPSAGPCLTASWGGGRRLGL